MIQVKKGEFMVFGGNWIWRVKEKKKKSNKRVSATPKAEVLGQTEVGGVSLRFLLEW